MRCATVTAVIALGLFALPTGSAYGTIVNLSNGNGNQWTWNQLLGPQDFSEGNTESNDEIFIFREQAFLTLDNDLTVDTTDNNNVTFNSDPGSDTISAGTLVDSYILHMDLVGDSEPNTTFSDLTVEFSSPILGLIGEGALLNGSDSVLGDPNSTYTPLQRGTWENGLDSFTVNGNTLTINSMVVGTSFADQLRVVTVGTPEPASLMMCGVALCGFGLAASRRRRQRTAPHMPC